MTTQEHNYSFRSGLKDGVPIGLGYFSVAFTFGIMAIKLGLTPLEAVLISMTNLTSAGQFAGIGLMAAGGSYLEMGLTQLIINLRYALMSLALAQKFDTKMPRLHRWLIAFGNTDEIFAVACSQQGTLGKRYMYGLITIPYLGWSSGTLVGAVAGTLLPAAVSSALGIAIFAMFLAIIVPPAKKLHEVRVVIAISIICSCIFAWVPFFKWISSGFAIILCTIIAAGIGAILFPLMKGDA